MRKLASIQRISDLYPIENADKIELAKVLGWHVVVEKGKFSVGDLVVYCEVDSILPDKSEFEFLRARDFRIKTIRLRGQISQGICFPLSILPLEVEIIEDADVTEVLGVEKFEPHSENHHTNNSKSNNLNPFPYYLSKTDETRVQVLQKLLDKYKGIGCYISEKVDGTSVTYVLKDGEFSVCSRNNEIPISEKENSVYWQVAIENDIENKMRLVGGNFSLQGEIIGEKIQSNKLKIEGKKVLFFNVYDIDNQKYLDYDNFIDLITEINLNTVPILTYDFALINNIDELVTLATRKSVLNKNVWAEGIVIRPLIEIYDWNLHCPLVKNRISFKVINPEFQLKYSE